MLRFDPAIELPKAMRIIQELAPKFSGGWVPWSAVTKIQYGTANIDHVTQLSCAAEIPAWKEYFFFANNNKLVKLSDKGILYAQQPADPDTDGHILSQISAAIVEYASQLRPTYLKISNIFCVARVGKKFVHAVTVDLTDDLVPSETPVEFVCHGSANIFGKVVGYESEGSILYVAFESSVSNNQLPGTLKIDRGYLLSELAAQLGNIPNGSLPSLVKPLFEGGPINGTSIADESSVVVADKLARLPKPWTRVLWGPPGAGKTWALGRLVTQLLKYEPASNILIVAPSNRAVDVAFEQIVVQVEAGGLSHLIDQRKILRFGYPRKTEVIERPELLGPENLDALNKHIKELSLKIRKAERDQIPAKEVAVLQAQLLAEQDEVKEAIESHVQSSHIVATTVTLAYLPSSPISKKEWNTVLVDEVTMVPPAICTFLASLATDRFLLTGDPRQLGPVYEGKKDNSSSFDWMGRDVFDKSRLSIGQSGRRRIEIADVRLARIMSQRRCATGIWTPVQHLYPGVKNLTKSSDLRALMDLSPSAGQSISVLDVAGLDAECISEGKSWQNQTTAELAMDIARTIADESSQKISIAIISPYRAQAKFLKERIRQDQKLKHTPLSKIKCESGTIHQFQGSDADIVIFDMVDGVGRSKLGNLLQGDTGIRLVNVAFTRAKGKLIILANIAWCNQYFKRDHNSVLWDLIFGLHAPKPIRIDSKTR